MTYASLIKSINHKLENSTFEKFKLPQVIDEINNINRDLANKTNAFETVDYMLLLEGRRDYELPNRIYRPTRAVFRGEKVSFISQEQMDRDIPLWETHEVENTLEKLVYNNLSGRRVIGYPNLTNTTVIPEDSEVDYLGQLSDIGDLAARYLYIHKQSGAKYLSAVPYGTVSDLQLTEVVAIYGAYLPKLVLEEATDDNEGLNEIIDLEEIYANALIYGVAGSLLFTSGRTEDINKGERYMQIYGIDETEVGALNDRQFSGGVRNVDRDINYYRTPFIN